MTDDFLYQQCSRCVMDTSVSDITFDDHGHCNYCSEFISKLDCISHGDTSFTQKRLDCLIDQVKKTGRGKPYDCIVGVSGGVDSSWTLVEVKRLGLRPLAVHMDNGWNSELAQSNISNLLNRLDVDLYTYVIDWEEYRELMNSFFDADVVDVEILYDNAMLAVNYQQAAKYGLKYILSGTNQATEGMRIPRSWNWFKFDKTNIKSIARLRGIKHLGSFPSVGTLDFLWYSRIKRIHWTSFLDYLPYNKNSALEHLATYYSYKAYPYKHYESIFTRFYQGYILPRKFGVDKRRMHLSTLVITGQMTREAAIAKLLEIPYPSQADLDDDINYFLKKMHWSSHDLQEYLDRPSISHHHYHSERGMWDLLAAINSYFS